ncbi:zinc finger protein OZF-like [Esox lucius]|uniref:C2H2-type domain-containing protein n=1 Tax=Esox lucius TaxID=8010 RepID=A0A6Q2XWI0_ESOLU|nr:zinc finger protein OZF-like [Esox lucius]
MSNLQLLREFLNKRLTAAAVEIFGAVEKTLTAYQDENDRLRRLLRMSPDIQLCRTDSLQFSLAVSEEEVPPDKQHCEAEWHLETIHIKEEQEEPGTLQSEEQLQGLDADSLEFRFPPSCLESDYDQDYPICSLTSAQTQTVGDRESDSKPVDVTPLATVTHLKCLDVACDPPDYQTSASNHSSAMSSHPVRVDGSLPLDLNPPMGEHCSKPSTMARKQPRHCSELLALKGDLRGHVNQAKKRLSECCFCEKRFNSTGELKAHVRLSHVEKPCACPYCRKTFKIKGHLSRHMRIHTGEKPFNCGDCGKSFNQKGHLIKHLRTHTGEKPFSCGDCGKRFTRRDTLNLHILNHTGEKLFSCNFCSKRFSQKGILTKHLRTHTGEKPFSCGDCGKCFLHKGDLRRHILTHTGEKHLTVEKL